MGFNISKSPTAKPPYNAQWITGPTEVHDEFVFGRVKLYGHCICIPETSLSELERVTCDIFSFTLPRDTYTQNSILQKSTKLIIRRFNTDSLELLLELGHGRQLEDPGAQWFQIIKVLPPKSATSQAINTSEIALPQPISPTSTSNDATTQQPLKHHSTKVMGPAVGKNSSTCSPMTTNNNILFERTDSKDQEKDLGCHHKRIDKQESVAHTHCILSRDEGETTLQETYDPVIDTTARKASWCPTHNCTLSKSSLVDSSSLQTDTFLPRVASLLQRRRVTPTTIQSYDPRLGSHNDRSPDNSVDSNMSFHVALTPPRAGDSISHRQSSDTTTHHATLQDTCSKNGVAHHSMAENRKLISTLRLLPDSRRAKSLTRVGHVSPKPYHYFKRGQSVTRRGSAENRDDSDTDVPHYTRSGLRY